ncbi:hypothetical protein Tco_1418803 [Tanacetum coccineum]
MISSLWSVIKVGYNKDAERGINHWGPKRQLFYRSQINKFSKHDVYLTQNILSVVSVKVNKLYDYGHLEEIMVRRADRQLYTFKEGDFVDLHLNNIEDMLLLAAQHKLFQLDESDIINLVVALQLYKPSFDPPGVIYEDLKQAKRGFNKEMSSRKWSAKDKRRSKLMVELIDMQMHERRILRNLERLIGARELEMDYMLMQRTV